MLSLTALGQGFRFPFPSILPSVLPMLEWSLASVPAQYKHHMCNARIQHFLPGSEVPAQQKLYPPVRLNITLSEGSEASPWDREAVLDSGNCLAPASPG